MNKLRSLLTTRLHANGLTGGTIEVRDDTLRVTAPAGHSSVLRGLADVPVLRFRQVLEVGEFTGAAGTDANGESADLADAEQAFTQWDCAKRPHPTDGEDRSGDYIVACDPDGSDAATKYLLAPAGTEGTDVADASAGLSSNGAAWIVDLRFTRSGAKSWLILTRKTYNATGTGDSGFTDGCKPPKGCNAVAIVLDGVAISVPAIQSAGGIPGGLAQISGDFTQHEAEDLAAAVKIDSLRVRLSIESFTANSR